MSIEVQGNETFAVMDQPPALWQRMVRTGGKLALWGALSATGGLVGSIVDPTDIQVGPHNAEATITLDNELVFDVGPFDSIAKPLNTPFGLHIDIGGIPDSGTPADDNVTEISSYLEQYLGFFGDPEHDIEQAEDALKNHFLNWSLATGTVLLGLYAGLPRKEVAAAVKHIDKRVLGAFLLIGSGLVLSPEHPKQEPHTASRIFDGTPLEGASVRGNLLESATTAILDYVEVNERFYDTAVVNLEKAFADTPLPVETENVATFLFYTDNHCNLGMDRVIGRAAELFEPTVVLSGGDEGLSGSTLEEQCVKIISGHLPYEKVISPGNHESAISEQQLSDHGFAVLNGEVIERSGLLILGDDDPRRSSFNEPIRAKGAQTPESLGQKLSNVACSAENNVDVLLAHDRRAVVQALENGCASLGLAGHTHREKLEFISTADGRVVPLLTGNSSGGAGSSIITVGPLKQTASVYVIRYNRETQIPLSLRSINIGRDSSVEISDPTLLIGQQPTLTAP